MRAPTTFTLLPDGLGAILDQRSRFARAAHSTLHPLCLLTLCPSICSIFIFCCAQLRQGNQSGKTLRPQKLNPPTPSKYSLFTVGRWVAPPLFFCVPYREVDGVEAMSRSPTSSTSSGGSVGSTPSLSASGRGLTKELVAQPGFDHRRVYDKR